MTIDWEWLAAEMFHKTLSADEKKALEGISEVRFDKGDSIISEGADGGTLYIIRSGSVSVQDYNRYEGRLAFATLKAGDLIGEISFLNNRRTSADVRAEEPCLLYKMSRESMTEIMRKHTELAYTILNTIINHEGKVIVTMRRELVPLLREIKEKASKLPWAIKVFPIVFVIIYTMAFVYIQYKDFSY